MKKILIALVLITAWAAASSQSVVPLRGDTIRIYKQGGSAELRVENSSRTIKGVAYNVDGNGTLRYKRSIALNDSQIVVGNDTIPIHGVAAPLFFISGSGTTLNGNGTSGTPYQYDLGGTLNQTTHISGSDLYDVVWDSVQNFKIVDHDGNYALFGSQNHNFQILGGPLAGSQHGSDLFDIFSANTANDHSSRLKMYPDSVELSFQSAGATGGWISKADGTLRFKGLTQTSNDTTANKVLVYNPADKKVHYANYASTGSGTGITQLFRDTVNNKLDSIYRKPGSDSVFKCRYNVCTFAYRDSIGGSSGNFIGRDSVLTITSGTSSTVTNGYNIVRFNPASVMATYSLTLPTTYHTSNKILLVFDADAITDGSPVITNLTIIAGSGRTLRQRVIPITADAGETISYHLIGTHDQRTGE